VDKQLFMGNGNTSEARCYDLVKQLIEAFSHLSALQQGIPDEQEREDAEFLVEQTVRNIYTALTGEKFDVKGNIRKREIT
jgi:hypothetical protein